jgi:hypothetical protein
VDFDVQVKLAVYHHFATLGTRPAAEQIAQRMGVPATAVAESFRRLRGQRVMVLEEDGISIRMAPPFSGVPTPHRVHADGVSYWANCAWDALGIPAALHKPARVESRCEQTKEPLHLEIGPHGPGPSDWIFHCAVPAARWWHDIVFT